MEYEQNARNIAAQIGLTEDQSELFILEFMDDPSVGSPKMIEFHQTLKSIHPDIVIVSDGSLRAGATGLSGIEVKMPIMQGEDQLSLVHEVYKVLQKYGYWTNQSAGLHVHIGKGDLTATEIANLAKSHAIYEESIDILHAPERRGDLNKYASATLPPESGNPMNANRNTIAKHLLREYNGDIDAIDNYIESNYHKESGEHLYQTFNSEGEAQLWVRAYQSRTPDALEMDVDANLGRLEDYESRIREKLTTGSRSHITNNLHATKYQKLNIYGKMNKTIEFRQAAAAKNADEAIERIKFSLNFVERFRNKALRPRRPRSISSELSDLNPNRYPNQNSTLKSILDSSDNMPTLKEVQDWDIDPDIWYVLTNDNLQGEVGQTMPAKHTLIDIFDILVDVDTDMADGIKVVRGNIQNFSDSDKGGLFAEINITEQLDEFDIPNYGEEHFDILPDNLPPDIERVERAILFQTKNGGGVDLRGTKINSGYKLAALAQTYRNPRIETTRIFYVKSGEPQRSEMEIVGHKGLHIGSPSMTETSGYDSIVADMKRLEADGIVVLHNHPDGDPTFSAEDRFSATKFKEVFGTQYIGEVVINSGKFSSEWLIGTKEGKPWYQLVENEYLDPDHVGWDVDDWELQRRDQGRDPDIGLVYHDKTKVQKSDPLFKPSKDAPKLREIWSKHVSENAEIQHEDVMNQIMEFGKELKTDHNWVTLAMANNNNELMAIVDYNGLHELDHAELKRVIREQSIKYGGSQVHIFVGEGDWYANDQYVAYKRFFQDENANFDDEMLLEFPISTFSVAGSEPWDISFEGAAVWDTTPPRHIERRFPQKERIKSSTKFMNDAFTPGSATSNTLNGFLGSGMMNTDEFSFLELSFNVMGDQATFDLLGAGGIELILKHIPHGQRGKVRTWLTQYRRTLSKLEDIEKDDE